MRKPKYCKVTYSRLLKIILKLKKTMHSVTLYTLVIVIHPHNFYLLYYVAPTQMPNYGFGKGRLQKLDRIGSDRIDKTRTGSDRINKTWIGLRPIDKARTGSEKKRITINFRQNSHETSHDQVLA